MTDNNERVAKALADEVASKGMSRWTYTGLARAAIATMDKPSVEPLMCRTFSEDGRELICDKPARYIVWGVLYGKVRVGPKCWDHAPKPVMGHDAIEMDWVDTMPHAAIYEIPATPAKPSVTVTREQVIEAAGEALAAQCPKHNDGKGSIIPTCACPSFRQLGIIADAIVALVNGADRG